MDTCAPAGFKDGLVVVVVVGLGLISGLEVTSVSHHSDELPELIWAGGLHLLMLVLGTQT